MNSRREAFEKCLAYYDSQPEEIFSKELFVVLVKEMMKIKAVDPKFEGKKLWQKLGER